MIPVITPIILPLLQQSSGSQTQYYIKCPKCGDNNDKSCQECHGDGYVEAPEDNNSGLNTFTMVLAVVSVMTLAVAFICLMLAMILDGDYEKNRLLVDTSFKILGGGLIGLILSLISMLFDI